MFPEKPFSASYWLKSAQIAAGQLPASPEKSKATEKLTALLDAKIQLYINLLEISEFEERPYSIDGYPDYTKELVNLGRQREMEIKCLRFPIADMGVPTELKMTQILDCIDKNLVKNKRIYFHCYAGLGRTGTVAGCWLVRHGMEGNEALHELHAIRTAQGTADYGKSPESDLQLDFVRHWKIGQ